VPVEVRLPTLLRPAAGGQATLLVEGGTVREVLEDLSARHPALAGQLLGEDGSLHRFVNVYVDDDDVRYLDGLDTKVQADAVISILPAVAGGGR
jgi:molybdopterin synthase sulfur carrier subunit